MADLQTIKLLVNTPDRVFYHDDATFVKDKITILAEVAEWSDEIDVERANEARLRAEKRLASHDNSLDMVRADAALKRSLARIKAVN